MYNRLEKKIEKTEQPIHRRVKNVNKKKLFTAIFITLFLIFLAGLGGIAGYIVFIINTSPDINSIMVSPKGYTTILYETGTSKEVDRLFGNQNRIYVTLDKIPKYLQEAVIAMEDERFYQHNGVDMIGIARAALTNITTLSFSEGASTITQQLIKNNMLTNDKLIERKVREQFLALELEKKMKKNEILELYLNTIPLGNRNVYGVQAAANRYFNKDVSDLTLSEATVVAAITQSGYYDPIKFPDNNKKRRKIILDKLLQDKKISKEDHDACLAEDVYAKIATQNTIYTKNNDHTSYFADEVIRQVKADLVSEKGLSESQALNLIYNGGLNIYTTEDPDIQKIAEEEFLNEKNFPTNGAKFDLVYLISVKDKDTKKISNYEKHETIKNKNQAEATVAKLKASVLKEGLELVSDNYYLVPQPQAAFAVIEQKTGYVKAVVGGRGEKNMSQDLDRATQSYRQAGSTFKVLASFAPAVDIGKYTLSSVVDDIPLHLGKEYQYKEIQNWYNSQEYAYRGLSTIREGVRDSMNIVAVKTLMDIGINKSFNYLKLFGFTSLVDKEQINGKTYTDKTPSIALGGLTRGVSVLELTAAYASIANNGTYIEPTFYTKVLDHDKKILLEKQQAKHKVLKPSTAFLLTSAMQDVVTAGTGGRARFTRNDMPVAGKTGTTTDNKDILFAGYTPYYTAAVWAGYDKPEPFSGSSTSFHLTLWQKIMDRVHDNLKRKEFSRPSNIVTAQICTESGKLAVPGLCDSDRDPTSTVRTEYFLSGTEPTEKCDVHVKSGDTIYIRRPSTSTYPAAVRGRIRDAQYELSQKSPSIPTVTPNTPESQNTTTDGVTQGTDTSTPTHEIQSTAAEEELPPQTETQQPTQTPSDNNQQPEVEYEPVTINVPRG